MHVHYLLTTVDINCLTSTDSIDIAPLILANLKLSMFTGKPELRLVGGDTPYEGRVEICIDNEWSSICDIGDNYYYYWNNYEASVACRQLGYLGSGKR